MPALDLTQSMLKRYSAMLKLAGKPHAEMSLYGERELTLSNYQRGRISQQDFDAMNRAFTQVAAKLGLVTPPAQSDSQTKN